MDDHKTRSATPQRAAVAPLTILYHHRVQSRDGQAVHIEAIVRSLGELGHRVIVSEPPGFTAATIGHSPKFIDFLKRTIPRSLYEVVEIAYNIAAFRRLFVAWREAKPDVIYERYSLYLLAGILLHRMTGTPLILEINAPLAEERQKYGGLGLPRLAAAVERWTWRNADRVLPVTDRLAQYQRRAGIAERRIVVIPNGVDPERFADADKAAAKAVAGLVGRLVLGFAGFMREWHGLDHVIDMLPDLETAVPFHLVLVGDGPARPALEQQVARLDLGSRVTFAGTVDQNAYARLLKTFDIALQPQSVAYASPLKLFEYMAAGAAIVAPDQDNLREVLVEDETALLFDPGDTLAMVAVVRRLAGDEALRTRLGNAARQAIFDRGFTWRHNAERIAAMARILATEQAP